MRSVETDMQWQVLDWTWNIVLVYVDFVDIVALVTIPCIWIWSMVRRACVCPITRLFVLKSATFTQPLCCGVVR